jgi:purine-binding chemotaxis protein CheW
MAAGRAEGMSMTKDQGSGGEVQQYLAFSLAGEVFGIPLLDVREIIEYGAVTKIPTMPPFIRGVINLRGRVVPIMDLPARFGGEVMAVGERTCVVIVELRRADGRELDMGLLVDSVNAVLKVDPAGVEPPPSFGARIRLEFIRGMWKWQEKFVILLDVDRILSIEEIAHFTQQLQDDAAAGP